VPTVAPAPAFAGEEATAAALEDILSQSLRIWTGQAPRLRSIRQLESGEIHLEIEAPADRTLLVLGSTNLVGWSELGRATRGGNGGWEFTDVEAGQHRQRFYRVVEVGGGSRQ
jgi:hypothetical protein